MAAHHPDQICRPPRLAAQLVIGIIEPENVDPAVIRDQLLDLSVHIGKVAVKVDLLILIGGIAAHGMIAVVVFWEIRVMPVDQGVVQTHAQPFGSHCVHKFPHKIAPAGGICTLIIRQLGIKQAETVMVLGGQHNILHARPLRAPSPVAGIISLRGELLHILLILLCGDLCLAHVPFAASGNRIEPPVQEHPKARVLEPLYPFFAFCHMDYPFTAPAVSDLTNISDSRQKMMMVGRTIRMIAENIPFRFLEYAVVN